MVFIDGVVFFATATVLQMCMRLSSTLVKFCLRVARLRVIFTIIVQSVVSPPFHNLSRAHIEKVVHSLMILRLEKGSMMFVVKRP